MYFFYPPFYKIIEINLKNKNENILQDSSEQLASELREIFKERILGPEYPIIKRIYNYYLKKITLKIERDANDKKVKDSILKIIDNFYSNPNNKSTKINIDVDPA